MKESERETAVRLYCPNCGHRITAYSGADGAVRTECPRCRVALFSKRRGAREIDIKMKAAVFAGTYRNSQGNTGSS